MTEMGALPLPTRGVISGHRFHELERLTLAATSNALVIPDLVSERSEWRVSGIHAVT